MISAAARIVAVLALTAGALADPVEKAQLRTSPKSPLASPGVYFDPESGRFRKNPPSAASIARYSERTARHKEAEAEEGGGGPLSSSEETHLSAVLPLVRFTRKRAGKSEAGGGQLEHGMIGGGGSVGYGGDSGGGGDGDILKLKRKKKLKSSVAQETIRSRPSRVKLKRKGGNGKVVSKKKIRVRPRENDFEDDEDGGDDDAFFGDYGSESRASLRNAPGRQFGAASNRRAEFKVTVYPVDTVHLHVQYSAQR